MATNNQSPNQNQSIDQLQSIQANLSAITDQYKEQNKQAGIYNSTTRDTLSRTTELNKLIVKSQDITSKIGKEIITQKTLKRQINVLQSKANELIRLYQRDFNKLTKSQQDQIDLLEKQHSIQKGLTHQADVLDSHEILQREHQRNLFSKMLDLENQGLSNSKEFVTLDNELETVSKEILSTEKQRKDIAVELDLLNKEINRSYKNQSISTALIKKAQVESAQEALNITKSLPDEVEKGNRALKKRNFLQEAFRKIPGLNALEKYPKHIEDFGLKGALTLGAIGLVVASLEKIVKLMFKADTQITDIQKQFSVSREQADEIRQSFYEIAANAGKFADLTKGTLLSQEDIYNAQLEFNKAFGTAIVMSAQQLTQLANVKEVIGLSEEGMKGLMTYSLGSGKAIQNIDRTVLGTSRIIQNQVGIQLNNKEILEEVYKISGGIRANFKGNVEQLSKAVTQAKLYGTTLEQVQHTSDSLLDFETSIESQLEAELLTGREINLERARAAALVGDMNTVMDEMVKQAGSFDKFMRYNVITQNSLAKSFGFTRDEMSDMLFQQKALEGLRKAGNNEEKRSLNERYQQLVKEGKSREELEQILGQETEQRLATQSAQERFNKSLEKLEDIFARLFEGGLIQKAISGFASVVEHLSTGGSLFGILTGSPAYEAAKARVNAQMGTVQDGVISPKGAIMISTPKGQIATNPGDSLIATTNPGGLLNGSNSNMKGVEAKLDQVIALLSKGGNVYIDGKKVGTQLALGYNATL